MKLYVGNLVYSVTEDELKEMFGKFGNVEDVQLITDKFTGQSKGFGFVEMPDNSQADEAIKALNETNYKGRNIKVNQAQPRGDKNRRPKRF